MKKRRKIDYDNSPLESAFRVYWNRTYAQRPVEQYIFHPTRKWRFDFCWPHHKLALEIQGYGPGHTSPMSMRNDADKNNAAVQLNWRVIYFTAFHLDPIRISKYCKLIAQLLGEHNATTHPQGSPRTYTPAAYRTRRRRTP